MLWHFTSALDHAKKAFKALFQEAAKKRDEVIEIDRLLAALEEGKVGENTEQAETYLSHAQDILQRMDETLQQAVFGRPRV